MNSPIRDEQLSDHSKYIPKHHREQNPKAGGEQPYVSSAPTAPANRNVYQANRPQYQQQQQQQSEEYQPWAEPVPPPPLPLEDGSMSLVGRIASVIGIAGLIALLIIFAKPISQTVRAFFNDDVQTSEAPAPRDSTLRTAAMVRPPEREQQPTPRTAPPLVTSRPAAPVAVVAAATDAVPLAPQPQAAVVPPAPQPTVTAALPGAQPELKTAAVRG